MFMSGVDISHVVACANVPWSELCKGIVIIIRKCYKMIYFCLQSNNLN